jgi:phosphoesterase RecJ-like protein
LNEGFFLNNNEGIMKSTEAVMTTIFDTIEQSPSIVIFGHVNPDGDCVGSVMGLKKDFQERFPDKRILAVGSHPGFLPSFVEPSDSVSDEIIKESLAIMVDLSDIERVEDKRITMAPKIVCFDHHIAKPEGYPFPSYRDEDAPSASYVLTDCLRKRYGSIAKAAAPYFFLGLVTDTGRFQYDSQPQTLEMAAYLVSQGVDAQAIYNELYQQSSTGLKYRAFVYDHFRFADDVVYCVIRKNDYQSLGMDSNDASSKVNLLALLDKHPMWVFFVEQENGSIRVEFRGDGTRNMQVVATQFGGGGHFSASGCRLDSLDTAEDVLKACNRLPKVK